MEDFVARMREWQLFYGTLAGVTATLVGLLFVALYMNVDLFIQAEHQYMKRISRIVFGSFILVLFTSLMFLIPHQTPVFLGLALLVASGVALVDSALAYRDLRIHARKFPVADRQVITRGLGRAVASRTAQGAAALLIMFDVPSVFYWTAFLMVAQLLAACLNSWDLLVGARERLPH
jgi:hypothetical protein